MKTKQDLTFLWLEHVVLFEVRILGFCGDGNSLFRGFFLKIKAPLYFSKALIFK
jgi:hypothetical protein